jgi:hypothetical protein
MTLKEKLTKEEYSNYLKIVRGKESNKKELRIGAGWEREVFALSDRYVLKINHRPDNEVTCGGCRDEYNFYKSVDNDFIKSLLAEIIYFKDNRLIMERGRVIKRFSAVRFEEVLELRHILNNEGVSDLHDKNVALFGKGQKAVLKAIDYAYT